MKRIKEVRVASWLNEEEPSTQVAVDEFIVLSIPALLVSGSFRRSGLDDDDFNGNFLCMWSGCGCVYLQKFCIK